jgi:hypothetical protein
MFIIPLLGVIATDVFHHANRVRGRPFPITHLCFYLMIAEYNGHMLQKSEK